MTSTWQGNTHYLIICTLPLDSRDQRARCLWEHCRQHYCEISFPFFSLVYFVQTECDEWKKCDSVIPKSSISSVNARPFDFVLLYIKQKEPADSLRPSGRTPAPHCSCCGTFRDLLSRAGFLQPTPGRDFCSIVPQTAVAHRGGMCGGHIGDRTWNKYTVICRY